MYHLLTQIQVPMRNEILYKINSIITSERGVALCEDDLLIDSQMDSFSYAVFWLSLEEIGMDINDEWIESIDYKNLKISDLINYIVEHKDGTH